MNIMTLRNTGANHIIKFDNIYDRVHFDCRVLGEEAELLLPKDIKEKCPWIRFTDLQVCYPRIQNTSP